MDTGLTARTNIPAMSVVPSVVTSTPTGKPTAHTQIFAPDAARICEVITMRFVPGKARNEWFIVPSMGVIDERSYYGYRVIAVAFAWMRWRFKFEFGVKKSKVRWGKDDT